MRAWNNKLQVWGSAKKRKLHNLEPANPTEEGLASLHSIIFRKDPCLWRCAMLYYTIYQVWRSVFFIIFKNLYIFGAQVEGGESFIAKIKKW